jgi:hypothetical protein
MHNIRRRSPFLPVNVDVTYQTRRLPQEVPNGLRASPESRPG